MEKIYSMGMESCEKRGELKAKETALSMAESISKMALSLKTGETYLSP
jgi:hypothetical protein